MYGLDDVVRSVRSYVWEMLGVPWEIDLERSDVADSARPAGLIEAGEMSRRGVRSSRDSGPSVAVAPVTLTLYPSLMQPRIAGQTARRIADGLDRIITVGLSTVTMEDGRPACGPMRLPLWDWSDVALIGTPEERARPDFPHAVIWAESVTSRAIQDPLDSRRWSVVLDLRLSWDVPGRKGLDAPLVTGTIPNPQPSVIVGPLPPEPVVPGLPVVPRTPTTRTLIPYPTLSDD